MKGVASLRFGALTGAIAGFQGIARRFSNAFGVDESAWLESALMK
jgi:hypothetical protein